MAAEEAHRRIALAVGHVHLVGLWHVSRYSACRLPNIAVTGYCYTSYFLTANKLRVSGTRAIILSNEGDNDSSRWLPIAQRLAQQGYLVLTFNYRDQGNSLDQLAVHSLADLRAAIAFMRARNVSKLVLIAASLGALDTVKVATVEKFDAIVVISAPTGFQEVQLQDSELRKISVPKLFVTSEDNQPFTHIPAKLSS